MCLPLCEIVISNDLIQSFKFVVNCVKHHCTLSKQSDLQESIVSVSPVSLIPALLMIWFFCVSPPLFLLFA